MGTGQTLLTIAALALLSITVLNLNRNLASNDISLAQNRYRLEALSLLNSSLEEATLYYFDEATLDTSSNKTLNDFTSPNRLGFEANDNNVIDDFDDLNNYTAADTGRSGVVYQVNYLVDYVDVQAGRLRHSANRTYNKRIKISIFDTYSDPLLYKWQNGRKVRDTLSISYVYSYWFYN